VSVDDISTTVGGEFMPDESTLPGATHAHGPSNVAHGAAKIAQAATTTAAELAGRENKS
jgi:hypothetical protein